jgi:tellurite resistance protein TerC
VVPWLAWAGFLILLVSFLALDLTRHRGSTRLPMREAVTWTLVWVAVAAAFGGLMWWWRGAEIAGQFAAGYLIEWSLSVDNVFVFLLIMAHFAVPEADRHLVLFWGVLGAIVMRLGFILGGAALLHRFEWMTFVFGGILLVTAIRFLREQSASDLAHDSRMSRLTRRVLPVSERYDGSRMLTRVDGRRLATPLLAAVVVVNLTDVIFAVDSIPAVFSVTNDPFVAFTSNALAVLGLRSLFFVLAGAVAALRYLKPALATVLALIGVKMLISPAYEVPTAISLAVIAGVSGVGVLASLVRTPSEPSGARGEPAHDGEPAAR